MRVSVRRRNGKRVRYSSSSKAAREGRRLVRGDDGALYYLGAGREPPEPDDSDYVGGGYRLGRVATKKIDGVETEVREILTLAAGGKVSSQIEGAPVPFRKPKNRKEALARGHDLWKYDPLGGSIVSQTTTFTFGAGLRIKAAGRELEVLRKFWRRNNLDVVSKMMSDEATPYGENFAKLVVHLEDVEDPARPGRPLWRRGQVEFVPISPEIIYGIDHNPSNVDDVKEYVLRYRASEDDRKAPTITERVPPIEKVGLASAEGSVAGMVHLKFNAGTGDVFGHSELLRVEEWLENYKEFLRDGVIINKLYRSPCYDITIKDADDAEIRRAIRRYEGWQIGANPVHNDKEKWDVLEFAGANVSQEHTRRAIILMIAAGVQFPEYFFADASNSNLASSKSQQLPAVKKFENRQQTYKSFWERIFRFVLDAARDVGGVGGLEPEIDFEGDPVWKVEAQFPPIILERDLEVAQANQIALGAKYMSPQSAAARSGLDYDQELELRKQAEVLEAEAAGAVAIELKSRGLTPPTPAPAPPPAAPNQPAV